MSLILTLTLIAQCNNCQVPQQDTTNYEWKKFDNDPNRVYLYCKGQQLGGYDLIKHFYLPLVNNGNDWGPACEPPIQPPCFGVDQQKISHQPKYTYNGQEISKKEANEAVEKGVPDDRSKLRVTVIGPEQQRKQVINDLKASEAIKTLGDHIILRDYPPDHWSLKPGFQTTGSPTIYCQDAQGKVLHRQDDYQDGTEACVSAIRKAKANYEAKKDPDLRPGLSNPKTTQSIVFAVLGGIAMLIYRRSQTHVV